MCKIPDEIILRLKNKDNNLINFLCIRLIFQTNFKNNFLFFVTPRQVVGDKYVIKKMEIIIDLKIIMGWIVHRLLGIKARIHLIIKKLKLKLLLQQKKIPKKRG